MNYTLLGCIGFPVLTSISYLQNHVAGHFAVDHRARGGLGDVNVLTDILICCGKSFIPGRGNIHLIGSHLPFGPWLQMPLKTLCLPL